MYELKKMERYLRVNLLGPGPRLMKKRIYRAAVSQKLRNTVVRINKPVPEANHSSHLSADIKNEWSYTPTPHYTPSWRLGCDAG